MSKTRCKFKVTRVEQVKSYDGQEVSFENVRLDAAYSENPEDRQFSYATPCGHMEFTVSNPNVIGRFKAGDDYYLDLTPCQG